MAFRLLRIIHGFLHEAKEEIKLCIFRHKHRLNILSTEETLRVILQEHCSIARFGDGEMRLMRYSDYNIGFQKNSRELTDRLRDVLKIEGNFLLCLPIYLVDRRGIQKKYQRMWEQHNRNLYIWFFSLLCECGAEKRRWGNASFTRPYIEAKNKKESGSVFRQIKNIWNDRPILIVEGEGTRFGVGNDLLDNAESIERILASSINAFEMYEEILSAVLDNWRGQLILLALGPTATVLAADLSQRGIQAIDIGHLDIEYEWFQMKAMNKVDIENKYVNEIPGGSNVNNQNDQSYLNQVIWRVYCE